MNNPYNIANVKNFYSSFNKENIKAVKEKYTILVSEFLLCATENIIVQNEKYFLFVLQRGLETIKHCFKMIYMYTRNLDLTIYHCKKAFCYYVEFIGQIGDDNHSYLQLNSKDATLFVYKKTIFEIDNDYRKKFEIEDGYRKDDSAVRFAYDPAQFPDFSWKPHKNHPLLNYCPQMEI